MIDRVEPFNSTIETSLRIVSLLAAGFPNEYELEHILALDHIVVHSGDVEGGPSSLHPDLPHRNGELLIRRKNVKQALLLLELKGLVVKSSATNGFAYKGTEFAPIFTDSWTSSYLKALRERASWSIGIIDDDGPETFIKIFNSAFDRWASEFQIGTISMGAS